MKAVAAARQKSRPLAKWSLGLATGFSITWPDNDKLPLERYLPSSGLELPAKDRGMVPTNLPVLTKVGPNGEAFVQKWVFNEERGWIAEQSWGFRLLGGQRPKKRRILIRKGDKEFTLTLAYDWKGKPKA